MANAAKKIDLMIYWEMLWRQKWVIIITALFFSISGFFAAFKSVPVYEAGSTILLREIDLESRTVERYAPEIRAFNDFGTIRAKILSPEILRRLIEQTNLLKTDSLLNRLAEKTYRDHPRLSLDEIKEIFAIEKLRDGILKIKLNGVNMIQIAAQHQDPKMAYNIVKTLVQIFIEQSRRTELSGVETGLAFSREQMAKYKKTLDEAEDRLQKFKAGAAIAELDSSSLKDLHTENLRSIIFSTATQLEREKMALNEANVNLDIKKTKPTMFTSPLLEQLSRQQLDKLNQLAKLMADRSADEDEIMHVNSDIKDLDGKMESELQHVLAGQKSAPERQAWFEREIAKMRIQFLEKKKAKMNQLLQAYLISRKAFVSKAPLNAITEERLKKEVARAREIYEMFLQQAQGSEMQAALQNAQSAYQYRILEPAQIPFEPISMRKRNKLIIFGVLGLALGIGLAFGLEFLNRSFMTVEEVEDDLQLQVVGIMPKLEKKEFSFDLEDQNTIEIQRITARITKNLSLENLLGDNFSSDQQRTILVTSSLAEEGKSTFSAYLAASLTMLQDSPVLLIDADLRRPNQHRLFKIENNAGMLVPTSYNKLFLLLSSHHQGQPLDFFTSKQFAQMLSQLKKDFPFIILDVPPILPVNDALILSRYVDAVLYIIKAGATPRDVVKRGVELLKNSSSHVPGIVLNNVREVLPYYYKSNYYKYKYKYAKTLIDSEEQSANIVPVNGRANVIDLAVENIPGNEFENVPRDTDHHESSN